MDLMTTGLLIALMVASFYFLIIRPNRKRQAEHAKLTESMRPGVRVMLNAGIYGTVLDVGERQVTVEIAPGVEVLVLKQAILQAVTPESQFAEDRPVAGFAVDDAADVVAPDDVSALTDGDYADDVATHEAFGDDRSRGDLHADDRFAADAEVDETFAADDARADDLPATGADPSDRTDRSAADNRAADRPAEDSGTETGDQWRTSGDDPGTSNPDPRGNQGEKG